MNDEHGRASQTADSNCLALVIGVNVKLGTLEVTRQKLEVYFHRLY